MLFTRFERSVAYRYLRSPRQEGFISVIAGFSFLGISLGVATLIIVMSVMNGFREELLTRLIGTRGHIMIYGKGAPLTDFKKQQKTLQDIPGVAGVYPVIERQAILMYRSQARGMGVIGIDGGDLQKRPLMKESLKTPLKSFTGDQILVGTRLAENLGLKVGDRIVLLSPEGTSTAFGTMPKQKPFTIAGFFEVGMHDFDKNVLLMPLATAQMFFNLDQKITQLEIFATHIELTDHLSYVLEQMLAKNLRVVDWQHGDAQIFNAVKVERNVMFLILTLIILIASFNIISSLIMLVKDKTRDIAILRTMGASQVSLMRIFFLTGATIGIVGTFLGVALGLGFALNIESIRQFLQGLTGTELFSAEIYFLSQLPAKVDFKEVIQVIGMTLTLSFLATLYPAWRAARLDPVEALRW